MPKQKINKKIQVDYKAKYKALEKQCQSLKLENSLLKTFNKPTKQQKIQTIESYYTWLAEEELDANAAHSLFLYKKKINKEVEDYE